MVSSRNAVRRGMPSGVVSPADDGRGTRRAITARNANNATNPSNPASSEAVQASAESGLARSHARRDAAVSGDPQSPRTNVQYAHNHAAIGMTAHGTAFPKRRFAGASKTPHGRLPANKTATPRTSASTIDIR